MLCCKKILKMIRKTRNTVVEDEKEEKDKKKVYIKSVDLSLKSKQEYKTKYKTKYKTDYKTEYKTKYKPITNPYTSSQDRLQMDKINLKEIVVASDKVDKNEVKSDLKSDNIKEPKKERLYCTHCGYLFPKPKIPVNYIITCEKCNRPLELPKHYYV